LIARFLRIFIFAKNSTNKLGAKIQLFMIQKNIFYLKKEYFFIFVENQRVLNVIFLFFSLSVLIYNR